MKEKAESHQCCILCEGATMQKLLASDNARPEDDGNASVSAGEGSWPESKKTWEYRYHRLQCSYDYIRLTEYCQPEISADPELIRFHAAKVKKYNVKERTTNRKYPLSQKNLYTFLY